MRGGKLAEGGGGKLAKAGNTYCNGAKVYK